MYYNSAVQIPMVKGKIITKKKGSAVYILNRSTCEVSYLV